MNTIFLLFLFFQTPYNKYILIKSNDVSFYLNPSFAHKKNDVFNLVDMQTSNLRLKLNNRTYDLLRKTKVFLNFKDNSKALSYFHPAKSKAFDIPQKAESIEFLDEDGFFKDKKGLILLHELAHAYHYTFLRDNTFSATYKNAKDNQLYDSNAYIMSDHREYFAELAVLYARDRIALRKKDSNGYDLVKQLFN